MARPADDGVEVYKVIVTAATEGKAKICMIPVEWTRVEEFAASLVILHQILDLLRERNVVELTLQIGAPQTSHCFLESESRVCFFNKSRRASRSAGGKIVARNCFDVRVRLMISE